MRRRLRSNNTNLIKLAMLGVVAMASGFLLTSFLGTKSATQALSATEFQAGRIIDDSIFYNPNTMTTAEIDAFIDSHSPACDMWGTQKVYGNVTRAEYVKQLRAQGYTKYHDPPFVCVSEYYENPETHKTNFETGGKKEAGMLSAGEIIYRAAHEYSINPQVLLVMLKKESYVWGDDWPHSFQYNTVMGYACPDGAPCDSKYFGFYNQVMMAAWQLNYYRDHIYSYNYRPYTTNQILYNPDRSCGSKSVYLENIATTSLYIYTPYVPNDGALANYPGTSYCGSYGNRNFYMYFREWFGSTLGVKLNDSRIDDGDYYLTAANSEYNMDWQLASLANRETSISIAGRKNSTLDNFHVSRNSDGTYTIKNSSSQYVLEATSGAIQTGTKIQQWPFNNTSAQKWFILDNEDGSFYIAASQNKNLVIGKNNETNELELQPIDYSSSSQRIRFVAPQIVAEGLYNIASAKNNSLFLDVKDAKFANNSNIQLWSQNTSIAQLFRLKYNSTSGLYSILSSDGKYALDVADTKRNNGANLQLFSSYSNASQLWQITKSSDNSFHIRSALSGKMIDITNASYKDGSNIQLWQANGDQAQTWLFITRPESAKIIKDGNYSLSNYSSDNTSVTIPVNISYESDSGYYLIESLDNTKYLSTTTGSSTITYSQQSNKINQLWAASYDSDQTIHFQSANNSSYLSLASNGFTLEDNQNSSKIVLSEINITPSTPTPSNDQSNSSAIDASKYYEILSSIDSSFALDVPGQNFKNGTNIWIYKNNGTVAQKFKFVATDEQGVYTIESYNSRFAIDVKDERTTNGTNIQLWSKNGTCAQKWKAQANSDGTYTFFNKCSNKTLDLKDAKAQSESNIQLWELNGDKAQKWILKESQTTNSSNTSSPTSQTANINTSKYYEILSSIDSSFALDVPGQNFKNGTNIWIYKNNGTVAQKFRFVATDEQGVYTIESYNSRFAIDVKDERTTNGTNIQLWSKNDTCAQKWKAQANSDGTYSFFNKCSNKTLDLKDAKAQSESNIQLWELNGDKAQKWILKE